VGRTDPDDPRSPPDADDGCGRDGLKAIWAIGYDFFLTNPNATVTAAALDNLEFVIVQDHFLTETTKRFGNVFLPAAASFEKHGTFMNAERRIQHVRQAYPPPGHARADWEIVCAVAQRMRRGTGSNSPAPRPSGTKFAVCGPTSTVSRTPVWMSWAD
jgi:formate dehydrogenase major subunit